LQEKAKAMKSYLNLLNGRVVQVRAEIKLSNTNTGNVGKRKSLTFD